MQSVPVSYEETFWAMASGNLVINVISELPIFFKVNSPFWTLDFSDPVTQGIMFEQCIPVLLVLIWFGHFEA